MPTTYSIAWWNLENLFNVSDCHFRAEHLQKRLAKELKGWSEGILRRKLMNLGSIIKQMNDGNGPDLLGVCEVESVQVLEMLLEELEPLGRNYRISHYDMPDGRGIDVAFIYDNDKFTAEEQFTHTVVKRSATRDLYQVNFSTKRGRTLVLVGNHWPSRSGGQYASEPYRINAAETLSYWLERIEEVHGNNAAVLVMGDFNDEPFDRSMTQYALSQRQRRKVLYARTPALYNLMWSLMGQSLGTHYYDNNVGMLDQFLISKGMLRSKAKFKVVSKSVEIFRPEEMVSKGRYPAPIRFGRPSSEMNKEGFSDHFPILMKLEER